MRKLPLLVGAAVIGAAGLLTSVGRAETSGASLCRRAPPLEKLTAEPAPRQDSPATAEERPMMDSPSPVTSIGETAPPPPAPPPPPPPAPALERGPDSDVVVTGTLKRSPSATPPPAERDETVEAARGEIRQAPPAGLLTAGDHDDLLNPLLYARYVARAARNRGQQVSGLPAVDTRRALTLTIEDSSGQPAPFVPVKVSCADGNSITLSTVADGRVVLFPELDRLGQKVVVEAAGVRRQVLIDAASDGQQQQLVIGGQAMPVRKFDLMITLDSTGSMGDEIDFLKSELRSILSDIRAAYPGLDIRVGLVAYRDIGDVYVTRTDPLTGDFQTIERSLQGTSGQGGGDMPEAMDQALIRAVDQDWRPDAVKTMLLVADAPPHDDLQGRAFAAAEAARGRRIQIVPVAASGVDDRAEYFMRAVAAATQSRYVFLTDDSGIGNPHAEPDVDCYVVTQLATAIRRVLASQISGRRVEPLPPEVIRVMGRYDNGRCVLPRDFKIQ